MCAILLMLFTRRGQKLKLYRLLVYCIMYSLFTLQQLKLCL